MKVLTINGCRDCPYLFYARPENMWMCRHRRENYDSPVPDPLDWVVAKENEDIPTTIHPDCKLPNLPTQEDVKQFAENQNYILGRTESIELGANYILNAIKK